MKTIGDNNTFDSIFNFSSHIHSYLIEQIKLADDKAKSVFTISAGLVIYLFNKQPPKYEDLMIYAHIGKDLILLIDYLAIFFLFVSCIYALLVIYPRFTGRKKGVIFFEAITKFKTPKEYTENLQSLGVDDLGVEMSKDNYDLSNVASKKFKSLNKSFFYGVLGFIIMLFYFLITKR